MAAVIVKEMTTIHVLLQNKWKLALGRDAPPLHIKP